jgi:magnesium-transporting ATPase (P-type)
MESNQGKFNENNAWWKPAMFFYAKVTSWIIFPIIVAVIFNNYLLKGSQVLFFALMSFGFVVTCYGIYKEIKIYKRDLDKNDDK